MLCTGLIGWGIAQRGDSDLTPRAGLGYALGIVGLAQMVLLLGYSARKRLACLRGVGRIQGWFELHMVLGLLAPTLLILHSNFSLGSPNSAVALGCTLTVAASGVVGRFLYARLHRGLDVERRELAADRRYLVESDGALGRQCAAHPALAEALSAFDAMGVAAGSGPRIALRVWFRIPWRARRIRRDARRGFDGALARAERREVLRELDDHAASVRRAAMLGVHQWTFGLWHAAHLPLSFVLFLSAAVHVVAVHVY